MATSVTQMSLIQARQELIDRRLARARELYLQANQEPTTRADALLGLAHVAVMEQELDIAQQLVQQASQLDPSPRAVLYSAMILGERGQRALAHKQLQEIKDVVEPEDRGFAHAVLAEQRIRQGYWDEGATLFVEALRLDRSGLAFAHLREVLSDMSVAIAAGKLPLQEPLKMLNRIDSQTPNTTSSFFAQARRHISQGEVIPPTLPLPDQPSPSPQPPLMPSAPQAMAPSSRSASGPMVSSVPHTQQPAMATAIKSRFRESMLEERRLNDQLQKEMERLPESTWPSMQTTPIDTIARLIPSQPPVSERLAISQKDTFRVTQGDLFIQLYFERCFDALISQLPTEIMGSLTMVPSRMNFLQINLLDGSLKTELDVTTSDLLEIQLSDHATSALAYFIGESFARAYAGTWTYSNDPTRVSLHVGAQTINPHALAHKWLKGGPSLDPGELYALSRQCEQQSQKLSHLGQRHEYIDQTEALTEQPLRLKLAELWSLYCVRHARRSFVDLAKRISLCESKDGEELIVFEIGRELSPKPPVDRASAYTKQGKGLMYAYHRKSGEFLMLAQESALIHALSARFERLTSDNAPQVVEFIKKYHAPGGRLIERQQEAQHLVGRGVTGPTLQRGGDSLLLSCWIVEPDGQPRQIEVMCQQEDELDVTVWRTPR